MISRPCAEKSMATADVPARGGSVVYAALFSFLIVCLSPIALVWHLLVVLCTLVLTNDTYSHIPLIPIVSVALIYMDRRSIFARGSHAWVSGSALFVAGLGCLIAARLDLWRLGTDNDLSVVAIGAILVFVGAFALFFGTSAMRGAIFPLLFLLFAIPIPPEILSKVVFLLQSGSASAADAIFSLFGIPHLRRGFDFELPGVVIRVAEECSGIRSSLALLITAVLACHLLLRTAWKKLVFCAMVVPIAILKNGLRIVTLSTLAVYVDPAFLHGNLHKYGGIPFFAIALIPLALLMALLQRTDAQPQMPARMQ